MTLQFNEPHVSGCNHSDTHAVHRLYEMHCNALVLCCCTAEALAICRRRTHCVISSQCHPRDYREIALKLLMKLKA